MSVYPNIAFIGVRQKLRHWLVVFGEFSFAQGLSQAVGMLCGIIFVRMMPTSEYAVYALFMTTLVMVSVGSDLGLTGSLSYFWRRSLEQRQAIEPKLIAIKKLRVVLFCSALLVGGLSLFTSVRTSAISPAIILFCFCLIASTAFIQLHSSIDILLMRLERRQRTTYLCESAGSGARFTGAVAMVIFGMTTAWFGLVVGLLGAIVIQWTIRLNNKTPRVTQKVSQDDWKDIRVYMLPLIPSVLVFMIQEPLVLWLAATRAGSTAVAEVFALGRIGAIYALVGTFSYVVLTPMLSRISDNASFIKTTLVCLGGLCVVSSVALCIAWQIPEVPLWLIGHQYAHLHAELLIAMATSTTTVLASFFILTSRLRGWVKLDPYFALGQLTAIFVFCTFWQFDTTAYVLALNFAIAFMSLIFAGATFGIGVLRPALVSVVHQRGVVLPTK